MWRKNRVPAYGSSGCSGTDLNRNFPYHWGEGSIFNASFHLNHNSGVTGKVNVYSTTFKKDNFSLVPPTARASCYQCDTQYRGPFPRSENESQAMSAAVQALKKSIKVYITVHSYSQMWLTRWGYSTDEIDDFDEQVK